MRPPQRLGSPYINQRNFALAIAGIVLALIIAFFGYEFKSLRPPRLEVLEPAKDLFATTTSFDVRGRTDPDADLSLNGRPLFSGGSGEFSERIFLVSGVNRLEFLAKNRYGKTTRVTRYIVVPANSTATSSNNS